MSLISYFFVTFDKEQEKSVKAGTIYIVMTHIGTMFILISFLLMHKYANSFDFDSIKAASSFIPADIKNIIFLCLLIGFGTKAGIVPFHIWLPYAHPQAPSHISSLMSGVMIKMGIYGILRFIISIMGINSITWGIVILILAALSCLIGVIYALMEHDIKKLLAYHSVENIGIILLGIGAYMVFIKINLHILALFSLMAGLYHLVNHAIFKSLLFLGAGSVYKATHKRNIEKLGGLIKIMPYTAATFLIGSIAIAGLPPLNGFISEWLILQSFFLGTLQAAVKIKIFMSIMAGILALTGGLAAACFVKAFGITFLAVPRSKAAAGAKESSVTMKISMIFLAVLVFVFGLGASYIIRILTAVSGYISSISIEGISFMRSNFYSLLIPQAGNSVSLSNPLIFMMLIIISGLFAGGLAVFRGKRKVSVNRTWDCGYYNLNARTEYTATGFSKPFRIVFAFFLRPYREIEKLRDSWYLTRSFKYETRIKVIFTDYLYKPFVDFIYKIAKYLRRIQPGSIHLYIAYILFTIMILVIFINRF